MAVYSIQNGKKLSDAEVRRLASRRFFTVANCDRCGRELMSRQMSWFTEEALCTGCVITEGELKSALRKQGHDVRKLEGCGYLPKLDSKVEG